MSFCLGQVLPTVPANIFRVTVQNYNSSQELSLRNQKFSMHGISHAYFDDSKKNTFGIYNSSSDLFHVGSYELAESITTESFLKIFNINYEQNLPDFNAGYFDTSRTVLSNGVFSENRKQNEVGSVIKLDYGMSNEIMLSVEVPNISSLKENYKVSSNIDRIYGADQIIDYHISAKTKLDSFFQTSSFLTLPTGTRDTLQNIYNDLYTINGEHSVAWALHAKDDPFSRGFIDPRFMTPNYSTGDTVTFDSLAKYYNQPIRSSSGIGDVKFGITALLKGDPSWMGKKSGVLYGRVSVSIPFGFTIEPFSDVGKKQFSQINIGSGVTRLMLGVFGAYNWKNETSSRLYGSLSYGSSASELLYTPLNIFSGAHTNPDSIISKVGETYKFKEGSLIRSLIGYETQIVKNRILIKFQSLTSSKLRDNYTSLDSNWDKWMEKHDGYDSENKRWDLCLETWILNSKSKNRMGPFNFDIVFGYKKTLNAKNTFEGFKLYSGITTYMQGW